MLEITRQVEADLKPDISEEEKAALMKEIEDQMLAAAKELDFEQAAKLRDQLLELRGEKPMKQPQQQRRSRAPRTRKSEH